MDYTIPLFQWCFGGDAPFTDHFLVNITVFFPVSRILQPEAATVGERGEIVGCPV